MTKKRRWKKDKWISALFCAWKGSDYPVLPSSGIPKLPGKSTAAGFSSPCKSESLHPSPHILRQPLTYNCQIIFFKYFNEAFKWCQFNDASNSPYNFNPLIVKNLFLISHLNLSNCILNQFFLTLSHHGHAKQPNIAFLITNFFFFAVVMSCLFWNKQGKLFSLHFRFLHLSLLVAFSYWLLVMSMFLSKNAHQYTKNVMSNETALSEARPAWIKIRIREDWSVTGCVYGVQESTCLSAELSHLLLTFSSHAEHRSFSSGLGLHYFPNAFLCILFPICPCNSPTILFYNLTF